MIKEQRKVSPKKKATQTYKWIKNQFAEIDELKTRLSVLEAKMLEVENHMVMERTREEFKAMFEDGRLDTTNMIRAILDKLRKEKQ